MRYASDFRSADDQALVRPSMTPLFASPGFSGLANQDHAIMLDRMARLRVAVARGPGGVGPGRGRPAPG